MPASPPLGTVPQQTRARSQSADPMDEPDVFDIDSQSARASSSSPTRTRRRKEERELVVVPAHQSQASTSLQPLSNPTISISPSSSAQSNLNSDRASPEQTRRPSTSSSDKSQKGLTKSFGGLSLKHGRKHGQQDQGDRGSEWEGVGAEFGAEGRAETRSIASSSKSTQRFSLKRKTSKLFGRDKVPDERPPSLGSASSSRSNSYSDAVASGSQHRSTSQTRDFSDSSALVDDDTRPRIPTASPQPPTPAASNVSGRLGGWFNSILNSSQGGGDSAGSASSPRRPSSTPSSPARQPFSTTVAADSNGSPSKKGLGSFKLSNGNSPTKKASDGPGVGRLGPFDRMLDKAVQYFLDSDSNADKCEDEIWLMGVQHAGYAPPLPPEKESEVRVDDDRDGVDGKAQKRRSVQSSWNTSRGKGKASLDLSTAASSSSGNLMASASPLTSTHGWPATFYHDFYSRIALTYRSGFPAIPCSPQSGGSVFGSLSMSIGRGNGRTSEGLSSDAGWGCMLRTGQSMLANALVTVHLGRDWRRSLPSTAHQDVDAPPSAETYARLLSLFLDDPSPLAPFSVHRFALMGKQLGKEIGEWFGPSTAAGAIKSLVNAFEPAGLKVVNFVDGTVYASEVESAAKEGSDRWEKPVLILIGLRLGIDGVNPVYHESIKDMFRLPQSLGIVGGRPSSSYYFVGSQADALFYIDPHFPRPAVPLRQPPGDLVAPAQSLPLTPPSADATDDSSTNENDRVASREANASDSLVTVGPPTPRIKAQIREMDVSATRSRLGAFLLGAYPDAAWRSYHCDKVRKMPLASMDPSMLLGFLVKDEYDWADFSHRIQELESAKKPIFTLAPSPPAWMRRTSTSGTPRPSAVRRDVSQGASSARGSIATTPLDGFETDEADEFSGPEEWELDSTDASGTSSVGAFDASDIEDGAGQSDSAGQSQNRAVEAAEVRAVEDDAPAESSIRRVGTPPLSGDEGMVVVDAPPSPSMAPRQHSTPALHPSRPTATSDDEGWQGVSGQL